MDIGLVGLGKMGGNMRDAAAQRRAHRRRLRPQPRRLATSTASRTWSTQLPGAQGRLGDGAVRRHHPRRPSTSSTSLLGEGDVVVDGGNSRWTDDQMHAEQLRREGHRLRRLRRLRRRLGPGERLRPDGRRRRRATSRRCSRSSTRSSPRASPGFVHAGQVGAGHFAKMVHNGIEYAMMQAYAEGYELLEKVDIVDDVTEVFESWREGTVDPVLAARPAGQGAGGGPGPRRDPRLRRGLRRGPLDRRGGDRQRRADADDHRLAVRPVRLPPGRSPAMKAVAALRNQFGGHAVQGRRSRSGVDARRRDPADAV